MFYVKSFSEKQCKSVYECCLLQSGLGLKELRTQYEGSNKNSKNWDTKN